MEWYIYTVVVFIDRFQGLSLSLFTSIKISISNMS